jgi:DNA polymerase-3 subunit delta
LPIKLPQLQQSLAQSIAPIYLVAGSEPLLVQEGRESIIEAARKQGYLERELLVVERGFDWENELFAAAAPSLFAQRKVIDLRLASGKPGRDGAKALVNWTEKPVSDTVLLLSFGSWEAAARKAKWSKEIDRAGVVVEIWPLKANELPGWITRRMTAAGLTAERDAVAMLAELVEGNLLAAQQEIDKLAMLKGGETLSAAAIEEAVVNSSRFDGFRLAECALRGETAECLRVSAGLQRNDIAIQPVTAALYNELALTGGLLEVRQQGGDERMYFSKARIWPTRQGPMKMAAQRLNPDHLGKVFRCLATIDLQGKGQAPGNPWRTLDTLLLYVCRPRESSLQI